MQTTFQVDLDNEREVEDLKKLLEFRLEQLKFERGKFSNNNGEIEKSSKNTIEAQENIKILKKFISHASPKQIEVLKWMKEHPGSVSGHVLKRELPFLAPQGTISGVFRPGRWKKLSGGSKEGFPFFGVSWNDEEGCGIYRGLTTEEAENLDL